MSPRPAGWFAALVVLWMVLGACDTFTADTTASTTPTMDSTVPPAGESTSSETSAPSETTIPDGTTLPPIDDTLEVEVPEVVEATPSTPEGDHYPTQFPLDVDADLVVYDGGEPAAGDVLELTGAVVGTDGTRIEEAIVEIWQADAAGAYPGSGEADPDFQGFGYTVTNANGAYRLVTVVPGATEEDPPHINAKVRVDGEEVLNTRIYLSGPGIGSGDVPAELTAELVEGEAGLEAVFVLAVAP